MRMKRVRKLILPVAGLGKRLRPLTNRRRPKALVRLNGGPLLEYMLKDADQSGIEEAIIVASPQHKEAFVSYIKKHRNKFPNIRRIHLRIQKKPMGDGHAVLQAVDLLGTGESVAVRFPDDLILDDTPTIGSLARLHEHHGAPIMLIGRVPKTHVSRYGIVGLNRKLPRRNGLPAGNVYALDAFVEKPKLADAPSTCGVTGGYVLSPKFIAALKRHGRVLATDADDALRLADVFRAMIARGEEVHGWEFTGLRLDCGTLEGFKNAEQILKKKEK